MAALGHQPEVPEDLGGEHALVADVVDGHQGVGVGEHLVPGVGGAEIEGQEARMPIVAVDDVRAPLHPLTALQGGPREQAEADGLQGVVVVEVLPVEERGAVDEVDPDPPFALRVALGTGEGRGLHVVAVRPAPEGDLHVLLRLGLGEGPAAVADARVERHEDPDVVAPGAEIARQARSDVGEPSGLGEGGDLRGNDADTHTATSPAGRAYRRRLPDAPDDLRSGMDRPWPLR